jgi:MFS family permease
VSAGLGSRFWRLFTASAVTNIGDGIGRICFPLLAVTLTREPILIAGVSAAFFLPWLLFALASGVLVDRVDRRRAMVVANVVRAVLVGGFGLAVAAGAASIWLMYGVAFALGAAETVADSAANAMLPAVVRRDQLEAGNGRLQAAEVVGNSFLGAPIGSVLFAAAAAAPFLLNSAGFAVAALVLASMAGRYRPVRAAGPPVSVWRDVREGVVWIARHRMLRSLLLLTATLAASNEMAQALLVLFAVQELRLGPAAIGLFVLAAGVGGTLGGVLAPALARRLPRVVMLAGGTAGCSLCYFGIGGFAQPVLSVALYGLYGAFVIVGNVVLMSLRQALIPQELFGRVQGAWRTVVWGALPLGGLLGGVLAGVVGLRGLFLLSATIQLVVAALIWLALRRAPRDAAADDVDSDSNTCSTESREVGTAAPG